MREVFAGANVLRKDCRQDPRLFCSANIFLRWRQNKAAIKGGEIYIRAWPTSMRLHLEEEVFQDI